MEELQLNLNINLPPLHEPYLNATSIPDITGDTASKSTTEDSGRFKRYSFLVNSYHHAYLISAQEKIKFERTSTKGFTIVEMFDMTRALCVIAEYNNHSIDCWDLRNNRLFDRIQFPSSSSPIQSVKCVAEYHMIITKLHNGSLHCHSITNWDKPTFVHRAAMKGDVHLDLIVPISPFLLCTFDPSSTVRFAIIDLQSLIRGEQVLDDQDILKALIIFDPPVNSEPIESIILPNDISMEEKKISLSLVFIAKTPTTLYWVHECKNKTMSYVAIPGQYDIVHLHPKEYKFVYASRSGVIDMYKVACVSSKTNKEVATFTCFHKYQLFVSIDTTSAGVTTINPHHSSGSMFLSATQDGAIQVYMATHAREALKSIPPLPRGNQIPKTVQLLRSMAFTLDTTKRELIAWTYQHSASIQSRRHYQDTVIISEFAIAPSTIDSTTIFVLVLTSNYYIEIYSGTSLNQEPIFTFHLRSPAKIHSTQNGTFLLVTNKGTLKSIAQHTDQVEFCQKFNAQLKIHTSLMLGTIVTFNGSEHLLVLSDNGQSMAIWNGERVIYLNISTPPLSRVNSIHGHSSDNLVFLHLNDQTLLSCQIQLDSPTVQLNSCGRVNKFAFKYDCLATVNYETKQLDLSDIHSHCSRLQIQLDSQCEHLCLNESATHVFTVVKPRTLWMYRVSDGQPLAKLILFDFVLSIIADNDFIVLAMNDRRLLTFMIADPKDPLTQNKIQALPSRSPGRMSKSATKNLVEHLDKKAGLSSSDENSDFEDEEKNKSANQGKIHRVDAPTGLIRFVTRFTSRHSLSKFYKDSEKFVTMGKMNFTSGENVDFTELIDDSDLEENEEPVHYIVKPNTKSPTSDDLQEIHQKVLQHEEEQIKGIQLANAGPGNLKIVNNYSVTSKTCTIL